MARRVNGFARRSGTVSNATLACLTYSLDYILQLGVENIQAHRQPMMARLHQEMPRLGFQPMTPSNSTSPIAAFAKKDVRSIAPRLKSEKVDIAVYEHRVRVSPSVYNDAADIDRLLQTLR